MSNIDIDAMPNVELNYMFNTLAQSIRRCLRDPELRAAYERFQAEYKNAEYETK